MFHPYRDSVQGQSILPQRPGLPTALWGDDYKAGRKSVSECVSIEEVDWQAFVDGDAAVSGNIPLRRGLGGG